MPDTDTCDLLECIQTHIGKVAVSLSRAGYFLATAESCTGGMIAAACTDVAGSSAWFKGGVVAYANEVKEHVLDVPARILEEHGAVSAPTVEQMALGVLRVCDAEAAIAVSGIAGPGGGTREKPVGTVWIALALQERPGIYCLDLQEAGGTFPGCFSRTRLGERSAVTYAVKCLFPGGRDAVRLQAVERSLRDFGALFALGSENAG